MSNLITLEALDRDGAIGRDGRGGRRHARRLPQAQRHGGGGFRRRRCVFSGFVSPAEAAISTRNRSKKNDIKILNYALTLEYLESTFYKQAVASGALTDER